MTNPLMARLEKLETKLPMAERPRRVFRVVAGEQDKEAAIALAGDHGFHPDDANSDDLLIIRSIVTPAGQAPYSKPPYITTCEYVTR